jgi:diguanylate cyclase (GGDEF)-like protein
MTTKKDNISYGFIDIDEFSKINNQHGHSFGDQVLDSITEFGKDFVNGESEFTREYGQGDEFLIKMPNIDKETAEDRMEKFREQLMNLEPNGVTVTASIGVATYPEDGQDEDEVIEQADQTMLNSEKWGGNKVTVSGKEIPTAEVEVWFEEMMRVDEGDLVEIEMWIDKGSKIRAGEIYNNSKEIQNTNRNVSGTFMSTTKIHEPIQGIVTDIKQMSSRETTFRMRAKKERLEEFDFA